MTDPTAFNFSKEALVFFDGECALCNWAVRFLVSRDMKRKLRFTSLQSDSGKALLKHYVLSQHPSMSITDRQLVTDILFNSEQLNGSVAQSPTGAKSKLSTVIVAYHDQIYFKSDAVVIALDLIRFPWPIIGKLIQVIPKNLRDGAYDYVAKHRITIFGRSICEIPHPDERERIIR